MQYLLIAAIKIRIEQAILTRFRAVSADEGHPSAIGRKRECAIHVVDHDLWGAAQYRGAINIEITGDGIFALRKKM